MKIDIVSDNSLIIPEYIINIKNNKKKTIELIEHFEKLQKIETTIKEEKNNQIKMKRKTYKKKKFYKKTK